MSTDAPVGPPVPGPTRRPRALLLGAAIAILAVAAVVLAVLLLRDPDAGPKPSALPSEQELATLRAEAVAATKTLFERIDQAYATGDPKVLDGLYVPGSDLESGQKRGVA